MRNSMSTYLHVTHPLPVSSLTLLRFISGELRLPVISLSQWTARLEEKVHAMLYPSSHARLDDSALTLLRHIQNARDPTALDAPPARIFGHARIASDDAWFASPTLHASVTALGITDVRLWLQHWRQVGMIPRLS